MAISTDAADLRSATEGGVHFAHSALSPGAGLAIAVPVRRRDRVARLGLWLAAAEQDNPSRVSPTLDE